MVNGLWGRKIGMTQVFSQNKVVPVTAVDIGNWIVTGIKAQESDGYDSVQVGCVRDRYKKQPFSKEWLKNKKKYFYMVREIKVAGGGKEEFKTGQDASSYSSLKEGEIVDIVGKSKGKGFAGVVKRHNFSGGPASHGSRTGRRPGSIGFMTSCGRVIKGRKMPGRMGGDRRTVKRVDLVKIDMGAMVVLVKGSVPGPSGSFVFIRGQGE